MCFQQFFSPFREKETHVTFSGILSFFLMTPFIRPSKPPIAAREDLKELKYLEYLLPEIPVDNSMAVMDIESLPESCRKL